ncbi:MAG: alpha-L-fucosidase [Prolixibacteraceae bacterium]|nr:alpha-L-fucosidase [Prolixibacteraceae bacterium]
MKRIILIMSFFLATAALRTQAQETPEWARETKEQKEKRMAWWTHDRFGMFIHWGIYALPARHEWVQLYEKIPPERYKIYFDNFNPDLYEPKEWAAKAKKAGMKYVVLTTKHHDGFCLWDSKHTDYKVTNTPYGKDLIKPFVDAFRAEGIKIGFYYSLIDWNHPHFPFDRSHPPTPVGSEERKAANEKRDPKIYRQYMKDQLTELLTQFGQIDELFMDFSYPGENGKGHEDWDSEGLLKLVRKLQPQIIVDNRLDLEHTDWGWDFVTPEQFMPSEWPTMRGERVPWETCQTFSGSWGYYRDEYSWKSVHQLIVMLIETVSKGGNLLLNVGPTARGVFDDRANECLDGLGEWMRFNSRSIYGCTQAPEQFEKPQNCFLTYNPNTNRLYVHVMEWPFKSLNLPNYKGKIKYVQLLNDASEIRFRTQTTKGGNTSESTGENDVILTLPVQKPNVEVPVIEIILE